MDQLMMTTARMQRCGRTAHCFDWTGVGISTPGVPGPTSKLSLRAPTQMGWRETEHRGGGETAASCCPAPEWVRLQ
jgi:hypothetical protein